MKAQKPAGFVNLNKSRDSYRVWGAKVLFALIAGNFAFTTVAHAQNWGTGQWGGMQGCNQPGLGPAQGATSESDEIQELRRTENDLKQEKKELAKDIRELERERERLAQSINSGLVPDWAALFIAHMDGNRNCCVNPPEGADVPRRQPVEEEPMEPQEPPPPTEPIKRRKPKPAKPAPEPAKPYSSNEVVENGRSPASAGTGAPVDNWGPDIGEGGGMGAGGGGGQTMCYPDQRPYNMGKFRAVCAPGAISPSVCNAQGLFQAGGVKSAEANACARAMSRYAKVARELDKAESRKAQIADELADLKIQMRESIRDARSEAVCTTCGTGGGRGSGAPVRVGGGSGINWGGVLQTLTPILAGAAIGGGLEYLNYSQNKTNNQNLNKLGWPTQPYQFGNYMYPFATAGIYGAALGGMNGGFGCAPGVGGGGFPYGPMGMGGPFGMSPYAGMGGAFGYPQGMMPGFPQMGGGMFGQGFGSWGMAGPWGNGAMNPALMGGMGGFGGMPGMGLGGMPGGFGGGMPGMGLGGMPGMGFGGMPGMGLGGMPGMGFGLNAGLGMGMPGMGLAGMGGMPGMGLGIGMPGMGGMGSPFGGMPGIGGVGGMYSPMSPFGGGMQSPFGGGMASPYGYSPYGANNGMMNPYGDQQRQYYNNMVGRQIQGQQLYTKYYSVMQELNAFNSGMSMMNSGIGGGLGGYGLNGGLGVGLGISGGLNFGTSLGTSTPWITGTNGNILAPGRSR